MDNLKRTVRQVVEGYAGKAANGQLYLTISPDEQVYSVIGIGILQGKRFVTTGLIVRIQGDLVIVECDQTDKIVLDALVQAGIPREQIILAYAGEPVPATAG